MGRRRRLGRRTRRDGLISTEVGEFDNYGMMLMLFETPSGFAIFASSEFYLNFRGFMEFAWAKFTSKPQANSVAILKEFQTFEDKSTAINADTGVSKQLAGMIERWHLPRMKLGVGRPEYKLIIESKLGITCMHNEAVMEVMWGIQHLMHILVPDEKAELTKEDRLPMSQGLKTLLSRYGFDVEPEMVNEQIVETAQTLSLCDAVDYKLLMPLSAVAPVLEVVSGFNCEHWDALKLATALKVICSPKEDIDFHEVLTQDELSKLKGDAPKYEGMVHYGHCLKMYRQIVSAHRARIATKKLLGSLVKEAKEVRGAEQAEVCEKGKLQGDSEQIPQEHMIFANLCRMILPVIFSASKPSCVDELPLPKVLKRSWDSAFEPTVANKSIFSKGSSLGETLSRRIARTWSSTDAQPSTSKDIVPYMPVCHAVLLRIWAESQRQSIDNMDADYNINVGKSILAPLTEPMEQVESLGIEAAPLALAGDSGDEAITAGLVAEHSEQNEVNSLENVQRPAYGKSSLQQEQVQAHGRSGLPASPPKPVVSLPTAPSVSNLPTLVGKVVRRSPRLNRNNDGYQHVQLEGTSRKRNKKIALPLNLCCHTMDI